MRWNLYVASLDHAAVANITNPPTRSKFGQFARSCDFGQARDEGGVLFLFRIPLDTHIHDAVAAIRVLICYFLALLHVQPNASAPGVGALSLLLRLLHCRADVGSNPDVAVRGDIPGVGKVRVSEGDGWVGLFLFCYDLGAIA